MTIDHSHFSHEISANANVGADRGAASLTASSSEASRNLLDASGAYDQCRMGTFAKAVTYTDQVVAHGAFLAWLDGRIGARFGPEFGLAGAIGGGILGAAGGVAHARDEIKGNEAECREKHRKSAG